MRTLILIATLVITTSAFALETSEVDCPALNESSIEKGAQEDGKDAGQDDGATQE